MSTSADSVDLSDYPEDIWMLRPCEIYEGEYKECKSIGGRFHQHYVYGQYTDCGKWKTSFDNCLKFRHEHSMAAVEEVLKTERERHEDRITKAKANDVWEYRESPPADWARPLPEWEESHRKSVLSSVQQKGTNTATPSSSSTAGSRCTIS
ncbi:UPF0545 protein C22orf39 homolog [Argonauta hians]